MVWADPSPCQNIAFFDTTGAAFHLAIESDGIDGYLTCGEWLNGISVSNALITRLDTAGVLWSKYLDEPNSRFEDLRVASDGSVIAVGWSGPSLLVARFSTSGTLQWAKAYSASMHLQGRCVAVDPNGKIYVGGSASTGAPLSHNEFVVALHPNGVPIWTREHPGFASDILFDAEIQHDSLVLFGFSWMTGSRDLSCVILDTSGMVLKLRTIGDPVVHEGFPEVARTDMGWLMLGQVYGSQGTIAIWLDDVLDVDSASQMFIAGHDLDPTGLTIANAQVWVSSAMADTIQVQGLTIELMSSTVVPLGLNGFCLDDPLVMGGRAHFLWSGGIVQMMDTILGNQVVRIQLPGGEHDQCVQGTVPVMNAMPYPGIVTTDHLTTWTVPSLTVTDIPAWYDLSLETQTCAGVVTGSPVYNEENGSRLTVHPSPARCGDAVLIEGGEPPVMVIDFLGRSVVTVDESRIVLDRSGLYVAIDRRGRIGRFVVE